MDFLSLFTLYVFFLVLCVSLFCCLSGGTPGGLDSIFHRAEEVISLVLPAWLQRCIHCCFHTR
ncbi:hypothetical protein GDO78_002223 [Eleutherodactylus coqui]|uniref:Uncharacterized protein n=2 Tax=Eleutherodactylus coqui TaxID=57060 RepID=A0A8J6EVZ1_ELECQ|nr:hypothetical protein GDO78_002223 [Eleutherodactylus coqui]